MPRPVQAPGSPTAAAPRAGTSLLTGAVVGLVIGALLTNLSTALVELDESGTLGAACEHAEATIAGAPGGLLVGLAAAACFVLLRRRHRSVGLALLAAGAGALVALVLVSTLLWPVATNVLPVFVCAY